MGMIRRWPTVTAQTVKQPPSNPRLKSLFAAPGGGCGFPPGCTMLFPACHVTCGTAHPPELRQLILSSLVAFTTAVQHFTCLEPCPCLLLRAGHFVVPHNPPKVFSLISPIDGVLPYILPRCLHNKGNVQYGANCLLRENVSWQLEAPDSTCWSSARWGCCYSAGIDAVRCESFHDQAAKAAANACLRC